MAKSAVQNRTCSEGIELTSVSAASLTEQLAGEGSDMVVGESRSKGSPGDRREVADEALPLPLLLATPLDEDPAEPGAALMGGESSWYEGLGVVVYTDGASYCRGMHTGPAVDDGGEQCSGNGCTAASTGPDMSPPDC